ncbi:MAG: creatininase family protein [Bacteroidales bacterium]|nr:creatininase family protein [Bacteroidales bacterium]
MRPYILAESNWKTIKDQSVELVVLPWGATEAHNYHLPYSTDIIEAERMAAESARIAWDHEARVIVLPAVPFGVNTGQADIKLDINLNPSTQFAVLKDITGSIYRQGVRKLLIVNGHGGNDFKQMLRELGQLYPGIFVVTCNWFQISEKSAFFDNVGDHADEMETSLMQFLAPTLVLPLDKAGNGHGKKFRIKALNEPWAWSERKWSKVTADTGVGDPSKANPEKGERFFNEVTRKISDLMIEMARADVENLYE